MKILYLFTLLLVLGTPASIANQPLVYQEPSRMANIVSVLEQVEQELAMEQMDNLAPSWAKAECEWQRLFDEISAAPVNKTYNQLQVSYFQFQQHQDVDAFRRDLRVAVERLMDTSFDIR